MAKVTKEKVTSCLKGSALTLATLAGVIGGVVFGLCLRTREGTLYLSNPSFMHAFIHIVWKSPKMSHSYFSILTFSTKKSVALVFDYNCRKVEKCPKMRLFCVIYREMDWTWGDVRVLRGKAFLAYAQGVDFAPDHPQPGGGRGGPGHEHFWQSWRPGHCLLHVHHRFGSYFGHHSRLFYSSWATRNWRRWANKGHNKGQNMSKAIIIFILKTCLLQVGESRNVTAVDTLLDLARNLVPPNLVQVLNRRL